MRHEPRIAGLERLGHHPLHLPLGVPLDRDAGGNAPPHSPCIRYSCLTDGKSEARIVRIDSALREHPDLSARPAPTPSG